MITLALDAATYVGTVAVLRDRDLIAQGEAAMRGHDVERLMPAVAEVLEAAGIGPSGLGRIVCGEGPGSFTSLRIAASIAKGLAAGVGCRLYAVPSLALIVAGGTGLGAGVYVALLDAMRDQVYSQPFSLDGRGVVSPLEAHSLIPLNAVSGQRARFGSARIVAPAALLDRLVGVPRDGEQAALDLSPHARGVGRLPGAVHEVNLATWEPNYGRLAEAQVKWEAAKGRPLSAT